MISWAMVRVRYERLPTEQRLPASRHLDRLSSTAILRLMHQEDLRAVRVVGRQRRAIASAIARLERSLNGGGRIFFVGAGTSGRLGVLEAAECPPTFQTLPSTVQAIIAGGTRAVFHSQEGAEDRRDAGASIIRRRVRRGDAVIGITASGVTPFVDGALRAAARRGAHTILITCHPASPIPAHIRIPLAVGPEVLSGSTRLKAGTATKLVLNMLTLGTMVRLGKVSGNLMVDVRPSSRKLRARALTIIRHAVRVSSREANALLRASGGDVRAAIRMAHACRRSPSG